MAEAPKDDEKLAAVAQAAKQHRLWEKKRNEAIREARGDGRSLRAVASVAGLHHSTVRDIEEKKP